MYKEKTQQELLLQEQLFKALKTEGTELNAKISRACEAIASSAIDLSKDQSHTAASLYVNQIALADLDGRGLAKVTTIIKDAFPGDKYRKFREIIDAPLLQHLVMEESIKRQVELENSRYNSDYKKFEEISNPNDPKKAIDAMLRDKKVAKQTEFEKKRKKAAGVSAGYVAQDELGNTFILKHFYRTHAACEKIQDNNARQQAIDDRRDGMQELIGSTMYQFLLHDRAPKEGLVKADEKHPDALYVRSKFFDNAVTLTEFSGLSDHTKVRSDDQNLKKLKGFEKAIAACHMLGEADYHAGNLMVQDGKTITKIDHGRSFLAFHKDFGSMTQSTNRMFSHPGVGYSAAIKKGNLSFSIDKYSESLNQMISQFDEQQMAAIVDQKIDELKQAGFDPKNVALPTKINNFDDLRQYYKSSIKANLINMQEIAKGAEIVTKFTNVSPKFNNGGWLEAFAHSPVKDPVLYAIYNNIKIEGINAKDWAYEHNYQIHTYIGLKQAVVKEQQWCKDLEGKWTEKEVEVQKDTVEVKITDPVKSMREQDKSVGAKLESLIVAFTKQAITQHVTDKKVTKFYDNIMKTLKKEKYLTEQDIEGIKKDLKYWDNIENTTNLLNAKSFKLNVKDTTYYKVGNFCEKIGLSNIANYCMRQISPNNLSKIHDTQKLIAASIKIGNILQEKGNRGIKPKRVEAIKVIAFSQLQAKSENHRQR
ncbi:hypothetical protein A1C_01045 [Rickettsia akari str. Hartford]|uniref:Uncharacterized protein n=1 Tax=Rickettsia akari (strain Hartford) TaxID=293614 RepID=A8GMB4_RICAH|nr:hypothetical protein [Rickettsia akari]ABV74539.1 hypothetical protein A1C_01045 [Rickettsia akari str. Hartford]